MWDLFTIDYRRLFPTEQDLRSDKCRAVLCLIALFWRFETSRIECRHAWLRRLLLAKSATWSHDFGNASADWVLARDRILEDFDLERLADAENDVSESASTRGGGSCRAFFSEFLSEHRKEYEDKRGLFKAAHEAYKELVESGGEALEKHRRKGEAATVSHRVGGASFGQKPRSAADRVEAQGAQLGVVVPFEGGQAAVDEGAWQLVVAEQDGELEQAFKVFG